MEDNFGPASGFDKDPALVVFRLCFETCFRTCGTSGLLSNSMEWCRPQPALWIPESFNLRPEFFSRWPRTGRVNSRTKHGKERDYFCCTTRASLWNQGKESSNKTGQRFGGR